MLGIGAAGVDVDVVVRAAALAREQCPSAGCADSTLLAAARPAGLPLRGRRGEGDADVVQHRVLHGDLQMCSPWPVRLRRYSAPRMEIAISMPVPVSPIVGPGFSGGPSGSPVMLIGAAAGLRDHVEGEILLERAAGAEALHLGSR